MLRFKYPLLLKLEKTLERKRYGGIRLNVGFRTKLGMIAERLGMVNMTNRSNSILKRKRYSEEYGYNPQCVCVCVHEYISPGKVPSIQSRRKKTVC